MSAKRPLRKAVRLFEAYLVTEIVGLLVWLNLGGGVEFVASSETFEDLMQAADYLVNAGLARRKTGQFSHALQADTAFEFCGIQPLSATPSGMLMHLGQSSGPRGRALS